MFHPALPLPYWLISLHLAAFLILETLRRLLPLTMIAITVMLREF